MSEDPIRRRAACDRCHAQKIRCPKAAGQDVCSRCLKAGRPCIFSPFRQKKAPEVNHEADEAAAVSPERSSDQQSGSTEISIISTQRKRQRVQTPELLEQSINFSHDLFFGDPSVAVDPTPANFADWMSSPLPLTQDCSDFTAIMGNALNFPDQISSLPTDFNGPMIRNHREESSQIESILTRKQANLSRAFKTLSNIVDCPSPAPPAPPPSSLFYDPTGASIFGQTFEVIESHTESDCIRKLSQLSIDLFDHTKSVPPMSVYDSQPAGMEHPVHSFNSQHKFSVADTFRLTQGLIDLYPTFLNSFLSQPSASRSSPNSWSPSGTSNQSFESACPSKEAPKTSQTYSTKPPLDHSSVLLILGCHLRLINLYEALFLHMQVCFSHRELCESIQSHCFQTSQLQIGNFSPPPSAAVPMQFLLLIQFASQLFNYAADLVSEIGGPGQETCPQSEASDSSSNVTSIDDTLALTRATAENVKNRASKMLKDLGVMRTLMLQAGHLA